MHFPAGTTLSGGIPPLLTIAADQASDQCCPFAYMKAKLLLCFEQHPDRTHMSNNSTLNACVRSGFQSTVRVSISIYNVRYGPRNNGTHMRDFENAASDMATNLDHTDALIRYFWKGVCNDKKWYDSAETSDLACDEWVAGMASSKTATTKGPQCGTSRWYSWVHAFFHWDDAWDETACVGTFLAVANGWVKKFQDLFTPDRQAIKKSLAAFEKDHLDKEVAATAAPPSAANPVASTPGAPSASSATASSASARSGRPTSSTGVSSSSAGPTPVANGALDEILPLKRTIALVLWFPKR